MGHFQHFSIAKSSLPQRSPTAPRPPMCGWPKKWGRRDGITLHESSWKWMEMGVYPISRHTKKKDGIFRVCKSIMVTYICTYMNFDDVPQWVFFSKHRWSSQMCFFDSWWIDGFIPIRSMCERITNLLGKKSDDTWVSPRIGQQWSIMCPFQKRPWTHWNWRYGVYP